jgi:predicted 3-demethylubiquinone-9 3-methyltransferase (glyoxalase superfamily)
LGEAPRRIRRAGAIELLRRRVTKADQRNPERKQKMASVQRLTTCLWFDGNAEAAARFYVSVFKNAKLGRISHYPNEGQEVHQQSEGKVLVVEFELEGQKFIGLNGGPQFKLSEAVSFVVNCDTQAEIDYYWEKLTADGGQPSQCGWLKDKFGLSWQVTPSKIGDWITVADKKKSARVFAEVMKMGKLDLATLEKAFAG